MKCSIFYQALGIFNAILNLRYFNIGGPEDLRHATALIAVRT